MVITEINTTHTCINIPATKIFCPTTNSLIKIYPRHVEFPGGWVWKGTTRSTCAALKIGCSLLSSFSPPIPLSRSFFFCLPLALCPGYYYDSFLVQTWAPHRLTYFAFSLLAPMLLFQYFFTVRSKHQILSNLISHFFLILVRKIVFSIFISHPYRGQGMGYCLVSTTPLALQRNRTQTPL